MMVPLLSRCIENGGHPQVPKRKRHRNRRLCFGRKKHYQKPAFFETGPFKGWPAESASFPGFQRHEFTIAEAHSAWFSHRLLCSMNTVTSISLCNNEEYTFKVKEFPSVTSVRVLSLCDGIATGLHILQQLKIPVEYYFSSEIDPDCITVQKCRWPQKIISLGDVQSLAENEDLLCSLLPIHIIFSSPPCQDLSLLNARRMEWKSSESSAFRTVDCMKIINFILKKMGATSLPCFWLLEQTSHMRKECLQRLKEEVKQPLYKICSSSHSTTLRKRFYSGNIPYLAEHAVRVKGIYSGDSLQNYLDPYRYATKLVASCITSNKGLLQQPVQDVLGKRHHLTIEEEERVMGLPSNYTSCGDLSIRTRQRLVGKAWNAHTLIKILKPLTEFFLGSECSIEWDRL